MTDAILCALLLLLGLASRSALLVLVAGGFALRLLATVLPKKRLPELTVERALDKTGATSNEHLHLVLTLTNTGKSVCSCQVREEVPAGLELLSGETAGRIRLAAGQKLSLAYTVRARRGSLQFGNLLVSMPNWFGPATQRRLHGGAVQCLCLPATSKLPQLPLLPVKTLLYHGPLKSGKAGAGAEFFDVGEFKPGDNQQRINWLASSRQPDRLYINRFEQDRITEIGLILDCRQGHYINKAPALFEAAVQAAASLAESLLDSGHRVGLVTLGAGLEWIVPGYGRHQKQRIIRSLAGVRPGESFHYDKLDTIPYRILPAASQVIVISPIQHSDLAGLRGLLANGYTVLLLALSATDMLSMSETAGSRRPARQADGTAGLAARLLRVEQRLLLDSFRNSGLPVIDWPIDTSLDLCLREHLPMLRAWRGRRLPSITQNQHEQHTEARRPTGAAR